MAGSKGGAPFGNTNAKRGTEWRDAIQAALAEHPDSGGDFRKGLRLVASRLIVSALAGEQAAVKEIGERFDGKAHQTTSIDVQGACSVSITPTDSKL